MYVYCFGEIFCGLNCVCLTVILSKCLDKNRPGFINIFPIQHSSYIGMYQSPNKLALKYSFVASGHLQFVPNRLHRQVKSLQQWLRSGLQLQLGWGALCIFMYATKDDQVA